VESWRLRLVVWAVPCAVAAQGAPPAVLPPVATTALARSLAAAGAPPQHGWRATAPYAGELVVAYIEIARGDRRKWEYRMAANAREVDRTMPGDLGGYPINYGYVPQTVSYDGDPFDALVLGPPLPGGSIVQGAVAGLMYMDDEKGYDAKVVLSPVDAEGRPIFTITDAVRSTVATYFREYKRGTMSGFSRVPGWGGIEDGRAHVAIAHAFFRACRDVPGKPCRSSP